MSLECLYALYESTWLRNAGKDATLRTGRERGQAAWGSWDGGKRLFTDRGIEDHRGFQDFGNVAGILSRGGLGNDLHCGDATLDLSDWFIIRSKAVTWEAVRRDTRGKRARVATC
jgi:hypothetical protein